MCFIEVYMCCSSMFFFTGGRSSFNWLTGNSIDTLAEYTVPSSSESLSSSMLLVNKRSEKFKQAAFKPVGPDFGKKRLSLPGNEVDSKTKGVWALQCNFYITCWPSLTLIWLTVFYHSI